MAVYKHVLVGLDLSPESGQVMRRARELLGDSDAQISLVHVQEPLSFAYGGDIPMDLGQLQVKLGSYGRHGLTLIFGSTANGVLHGATCDVLAVRIQPEKTDH